MTRETLTVVSEGVPLDLLLWRRFKDERAGRVENTLAINPGLADLGPLLPLGTRVAVEIPAPAADRAPPKVRLVRLTD